jgi:hypothetical protein
MGLIHWDLWLTAGALLGVLSLGAWAIYKIKLWREETAVQAPLSPDEQLDHYRQMMEAGDLDPQEFARIEAQMKPTSSPPDTSIRE